MSCDADFFSFLFPFSFSFFSLFFFFFFSLSGLSNQGRCGSRLLSYFLTHCCALPFLLSKPTDLENSKFRGSAGRGLCRRPISLRHDATGRGAVSFPPFSLITRLIVGTMS